MEHRAYSLFENGFQMCTQQFVEASLLPVDREYFHNFDMAIASLSIESIVDKEKGSKD